MFVKKYLFVCCGGQLVGGLNGMWLGLARVVLEHRLRGMEALLQAFNTLFQHLYKSRFNTPLSIAIDSSSLHILSRHSDAFTRSYIGYWLLDYHTSPTTSINQYNRCSPPAPSHRQGGWLLLVCHAWSTCKGLKAQRAQR